MVSCLIRSYSNWAIIGLCVWAAEMCLCLNSRFALTDILCPTQSLAKHVQRKRKEGKWFDPRSKVVSYLSVCLNSRLALTDILCPTLLQNTLKESARKANDLVPIQDNLALDNLAPDNLALDNLAPDRDVPRCLNIKLAPTDILCPTLLR